MSHYSKCQTINYGILAVNSLSLLPTPCLSALMAFFRAFCLEQHVSPRLIGVFPSISKGAKGVSAQNSPHSSLWDAGAVCPQPLTLLQYLKAYPDCTLFGSCFFMMCAHLRNFTKQNSCLHHLTFMEFTRPDYNHMLKKIEVQEGKQGWCLSCQFQYYVGFKSTDSGGQLPWFESLYAIESAVWQREIYILSVPLFSYL